jgi:hypothetical protein
VITSIFCRTNASPGARNYPKSRRAGRERGRPAASPEMGLRRTARGERGHDNVYRPAQPFLR